jgi:homoserine kinase
VKQETSASRLLFSAAAGDWKTFASAVNSDVIVEKAREKIYPWFRTLKSAALEVGALGCSLCGAGPSVFALSFADGKRLDASKWLSFAKEERLDCSIIETRVDNEGAKIETADE